MCDKQFLKQQTMRFMLIKFAAGAGAAPAAAAGIRYDVLFHRRQIEKWLNFIQRRADISLPFSVH